MGDRPDLPPRDPARFPKGARLRIRREFLRVQARGRKLHSRAFLILVAPAEYNESRVGITVTTKVAKRAVVRNRIKRRVRDIFRRNRNGLREPLDIVIIARGAAVDCTYQEMSRQILGTLQSHGYHRPPTNQ